jgi:hypothetical protein
MTLKTARGQIDSARPDDIDLAFTEYAARGEFAILSIGPEKYIQVGGEGDGPLVLEYRESAAGRHFQATQKVNAAEARLAFLDYLGGGSTWLTSRAWTELKEEKGCAAGSAALLLGLSLAAGLSYAVMTIMIT